MTKDIIDKNKEKLIEDKMKEQNVKDDKAKGKMLISD